MARDATHNPIMKPDIRKQSYLVSQQNNLLANREESIYGTSEAEPPYAPYQATGVAACSGAYTTGAGGADAVRRE